MKILIRRYILSVLFVFLSLPLMAQHVIKEEGVQIDEVVVTAKMPPVIIKKDTTIINTSVYKVPEGSDLKDLVKRIPGLEYDEKNNTLTYNGKYISEIDVNGESFFMDNIRIALESLPADFVGRIKVYDKRSEQEVATGIDDGNENYVLDIQTKEELNNTFLASAEAGAGNKRKKELKTRLNYFQKGGENFSVIGESRNSGNNSFSKDNIETSVGTNFMKRFGKKQMIQGEVKYESADRGSVSSYNIEQYLKEGNRYHSAIMEDKNKSNSFYTNLRWKWEINKRLILNVSGNIRLYNSKIMSGNQSGTFNASPEFDVKNPFVSWKNIPNDIIINRDNKSSSSKSDNDSYDFKMDLTYYLNKKGTNVNLSMDYSDRLWDSESDSEDETTYFQLKDKLGNDSVSLRKQYKLSPSSHSVWNAGVSVTHPISKKVRLQVFYKWMLDDKGDERKIYDLSTEEKVYIDSLGSSNYDRIDKKELGAYINYSSGKWTVNSSFTAIPQGRKLRSTMGQQWVDTILHTVDYRLYLFMSWKNDKFRTDLRYDMNTKQPASSNLISLVDHNNPLYITYGNPDLKASCRHDIRWDMSDTKNNLFANVTCNINQNNITRIYIYNSQTGGGMSYPVNVNGEWFLRTNMHWIKNIGKVELFLRGEGNYENQVTLVNENHTEQPERSVTRRTSLNGSCQLSYNPKWGAIRTKADYRFVQALNTLRDESVYSRIWICYLEGYVNLPGNVQLSTDVTSTFQNGTKVQADERAEILWNAKATWRFLKKKQAELIVRWVDILADSKEISRYASASGFSEYYSQNIRGYIIATFKYKFRIMK